ncbi:hypothetical protein PGT21_018328 [Puccinia graminis f. sp. tritici]|uniref:Uncharacterized protein n=1 Tax=Puccinia graminis f. sp. tritici TaxID=56615 RepID=A0A5B0LVD6_PUCGR|nr:hypothetical protein PGT21_018328 [Puccinia graminis f. sp. tritici]KAA1093417.1 hypothetical protein PGTUg99_011067 [Puccinia graminis f. sp. tritici]
MQLSMTGYAVFLTLLVSAISVAGGYIQCMYCGAPASAAEVRTQELPCGFTVESMPGCAECPELRLKKFNECNKCKAYFTSNVKHTDDTPLYLKKCKRTYSTLLSPRCETSYSVPFREYLKRPGT